jgi:hypothetical protein
MMLNHNHDVENKEANGTVGFFEGIELKDGVTLDNLELMRIDEYWVRSACVSQVKSIVLRHEEKAGGDLFHVRPQKETCLVDYPVPTMGYINKQTPRIKQWIQLTQFLILCNNATTVHKLQGRTIKHLVVNNFDYTDNWVYVVLSRVTTQKGLFL